jgi:hypothetical protein
VVTAAWKENHDSAAYPDFWLNNDAKHFNTVTSTDIYRRLELGTTRPKRQAGDAARNAQGHFLSAELEAAEAKRARHREQAREEREDYKRECEERRAGGFWPQWRVRTSQQYREMIAERRRVAEGNRMAPRTLRC